MRSSLTAFTRRRSAGSTPSPASSSGARGSWGVPPRFEAVAEALARRAGVEEACAEAGRALAWDGVSLGEALTGLRATCVAVGAVTPGLEAVESLSVAWSEATLEFLHDVSCEDPLTGLASLPHLRTRLAEVYREAERTSRPVRVSHALLVVDVGGGTGGDVPTDTFSRALGLAAVADVLRTVFSGEETIARVGAARVVALVRRTPELGETVTTTRALLADVGMGGARTWIEGLPTVADLGVRVLSELAR